MSYADCTGEGTSQAEVPSPEGPLAIWCLGQLVLVSGFDCFVPVKHSFRECAVAIRLTLALFSFARLDIQRGLAFNCL